jgi:hypothetical protein
VIEEVSWFPTVIEPQPCAYCGAITARANKIAPTCTECSIGLSVAWMKRRISDYDYIKEWGKSLPIPYKDLGLSNE